MAARCSTVSIIVATLALGGCNLLQQWRPESVTAYKPVFEQASRGDVPAVTAALDRDPRLIRAHEEDGSTLLHDATTEGQVRMAALLIDRGARLDARTGGGLTPLHLAAQNGDLAMVELLVGRGAKVNAIDHDRRTPLDHALRHDHPDAVRWLRMHGGRTGSEDTVASAP